MIRFLAILGCGFVLLACSNAGDSAGPFQTGAGGAGGSTVGGTGGVPGGAGGTTEGTGGVIGGAGGTVGGTGGSVGGTGGQEAGSGAAGQAGEVGGTGGVVEEQEGCPGSTLLALPDNPGATGPWEVGDRTVSIGRLAAVEVVYPAKPGSTEGLPQVTYNPRDWAPISEQSKILDEDTQDFQVVGEVMGHVYKDVPIDDERGPYPVIIFIHGTSSVRLGSASINAHWASHGFIVLSADYPGLGTVDQLCMTAECAGRCVEPLGIQDVPGDVNLQLNALKDPSGELAFLAGHVDMTRIGLSGHSQGGCMSAFLSSSIPNVRISVPLDASELAAGSDLESVLFVGGMSDNVISYAGISIGSIVCPGLLGNQMGGYNNTPVPSKGVGIKRIVGIEGGAHMVPTDLCRATDDGDQLIPVMQERGVCGVNTAVIIGLPILVECGTISPEDGIRAINYVTTAALEETLHCQDRTEAFNDLMTKVPHIGDYQHSP